MALVAGGFVRAQDAQSNPGGNAAEASGSALIRTQVEYIEVTQKDMVELLYGPRDAGDDSKLRDKLQEMMKKGKARMVETQMVVCRSGEKSATQSIQEYIYATEYEPSDVPNEVNRAGKNTGQLVRALSTAPTPTAFKTRNLGSTFEVVPTARNDGKTIDVELAPEIVYHVRNDKLGEWSEGEGKRVDLQMPVIYTVRMNTGITLPTGKYVLAAALSPKDDEGFPDFEKKILIFVKADVLKMGS